MNTACYIEIGQSNIQVLCGERTLEWPLERLANGRLTDACRHRVRLSLESLLPRTAWAPRARILCAINARGVSLRRMTVPVATKETLHRLMRLQIEGEFPLPPDDLAWGYQHLGETKARNGEPAQQEFLVMAVRKDVIEDYAQLFPNGSSSLDFTLAALARNFLCSASLGDYAILDLGAACAEWIHFENGVPAEVRTLAWGGDKIAGSIADRLKAGGAEAERRKPEGGAPVGEGRDGLVQEAFGGVLDSLADALKNHRRVVRLYLTGAAARHHELISRLSQRLGGVVCEPLEPATDHGSSAALAGLMAAAKSGNAPLLFQLQAKPSNGTARPAQTAPWKWVGLAAILLAGLLALPYLEAFLLKPRLARKLANLKADQGRLTLIDQELGFLRHVKQNQSPYLDTVYVLAKSIPMGGRIESLSMNRRGELALRGSLKDSKQVTDFRSKLIDSGLFATVTIEEQTPTPDRQKLIVRMSAQWSPAAARQNLALGPTAEEIEKAKTARKDGPPGFSPPGPGPTGMPGMRTAGPPSSTQNKADEKKAAGPAMAIPGPMNSTPQPPNQ